MQLLQLLPRAFHPTIVDAACRDDGDNASYASLVIRHAPHCRNAPSAYDDPANRCNASITFQLLAAAAPLAGGCLDHAWRADGTEWIQRAAERLRCGQADTSRDENMAPNLRDSELHSTETPNDLGMLLHYTEIHTLPLCLYIVLSLCLWPLQVHGPLRKN